MLFKWRNESGEERIAAKSPGKGWSYVGPADKADTSGTPPPRIEQDGVVYERQADGTWAPAKGLPRTQKAAAKPKIKAIKGFPRIGTDAEGSYYILDAVGENVAEFDPTAPEPQRRLEWREMTPEEYLQAEEAGVFDPETARSGGGGGLTAYQSAQLERQAEQDRRELVRLAREENADFQREMFKREQAAIENEQKRTAEARASLALADDIAARRENTRLARETLQQRQLENEQQLQLSREAAGQRSKEFAATFGQREREFAAENAQRQQQEQRQRAETAGLLAANPGDVGKLAGFLTAGGLSPISTMLGQGQTAITDRSMEPLASLLAPPPQSAPGAVAASADGDPDTYDFSPEEYGRLERAVNAQSGGSRDPMFIKNLRNALFRSGVHKRPEVPFAEEGAGVVSMDRLVALARALGMQPKAVAGEQGKSNGETVWSNGDVVITPDRGKGLPQMQGGGIAGQYGSAFDPRLIALARQFLAQSGKTALERSGFGAPPSPIELSDPGTSGFLRQLGAATTAATKGINPQAYMEELNRLIPQAQQFGLMRRSI